MNTPEQPMPMPPALFRAASPASPQNIAKQKEMHAQLNGFFDGICAAIKFAHDLWRTQAAFTGIVAHGVTASGGSLQGPALQPLIKAAPGVAAMTGWPAKLRDGVADGLGMLWTAFQSGVTVPGLPWFPQAAAAPGLPSAPMPNTPTPFSMLSYPKTFSDAQVIKAAIMSRMPPGTEHAEQVATALAENLTSAFTVWFAAQIVTGVIRQGATCLPRPGILAA